MVQSYDFILVLRSKIKLEKISPIVSLFRRKSFCTDENEKKQRLKEFLIGAVARPLDVSAFAPFL